MNAGHAPAHSNPKEIMDVRIEKLIYGGEGLGHEGGQTVFVPFVLPGETVSVRAVERRKKFVRGRIEQIVTPAPERVAAPCPHFTVCGGCHYQHIPYETQLTHKTEILRETLRRMGRVEWTGAIHTHSSPPFGYRNRAQWKVRPAGDVVGIGYFRAGSSALCAVEECGVLSPLLAKTLDALRGMIRDAALPAALLREVEAFADHADEKILLAASFNKFDGSPGKMAETFRAAIPWTESLLLHESSRDRFQLDGPGFLDYSVGEIALRVGHLSFFQVNRHLLSEMVQHVVGTEEGALALDLYSGVGLFSVPLARRFARVVAVESNEAAARDLEANATRHGGENQVVNADVQKFLSACPDAPDLVVVDPPRAGLEKEIVADLLRIAPRQIAYLSCDPSTLGRDLGLLTAADAAPGYDIAEIRLFDVFPQTYHIETLVRLMKRA